ncbi:MAG TPA: hypothetical protein VGK94_08980 [Candidatus Polarisedimenticolia bacterium]
MPSSAWLGSVLPGPVPRETTATCDRCVMCEPRSTGRGVADLSFDSRVKCCTYHPELPNFLVGRILSDPDPELARGREAVESKLRAEVGVGPLGIHPPPEYLELFHQSADGFGRKIELRCPYYVVESGRCGIWRHRTGVCSTWFCKHDRGAVGARFWAALGSLLLEVERRVAHWCAAELVAGMPPPADPWGPWRGRAAEFYRECARRVEPLGWDDIVRICGPSVEDLARAAVEAFRQMESREVPDALGRGSFEVVARGPDRVRLRSYNPFDPIDLPAWVLEAVDRFDGGPSGDALARIAREMGVWMPSTLARTLCDFEILVPAQE